MKSAQKGTDMNTIAANELKRHGITAIEKLITKGPVHVIKRNQPVCVVLAEEEYERLIHAAKEGSPERQLSVMEWFSLPALGSAEKKDLDDRLSQERDGWEK
jgi:PHD/YefM family antitoxin component YafN of YafNO toxin-antitoxin module